MSSISKRRREGSRAKIKSMGDHKEFLKRITKTLYYAQLPSLPCLSLPVTEISCEVWSAWQRGRSVRRLHADAAARLARGACVSPCALVLALLYLERLNACNPDYLANTAPNDLFLVTLMVGNKFLQDDGEDDEVLCSEWAASGGVDLKYLKKLEVEFLNAIDWKVFVSEELFETRLKWLERRVALQQALLRGFFTYTDLAAACDMVRRDEIARALLAATLTAAAAGLAALLACLASTVLVSHLCLPSLRHVARLDAAPLLADIEPHATLLYSNDTANVIDLAVVEGGLTRDSTATDKLKCCNGWLRYQDATAVKKNYNSMGADGWRMFEWSKVVVLDWLYRSSLVDPVQRWLERIDEYADLSKRRTAESPKRVERCHDHVRFDEKHHCVRQWLNLSKLGALVVAVSDR